MEVIHYMSKSYKKYPIVKQEKFRRLDKKYWNRRIRNLDIDYCLNGSQYKKIFQNWNTWQYPWFLEDALKTYHENEYWQEEYPNVDDFINYWKRCCVRK